MKVLVDDELCVGNGICERVAPGVFALGDDTVSRVLVDEVPEDQHAAATDAVSSCPARALRITG